jgi:lysyl-tRNA synthetase class I
MRAVLNINTNVQLNFKQIAEVARQLPKPQKVKLATILTKETEEEDTMTKAELVARIKEVLEEVKLYKEGKVKFRTLKEFLDDV